MFVVSNIEALQSQLKNIYTNTLSTLCPLPWLEEAEDVQYNFDDVFIPLRTIDIDIQQKDEELSGPSDKRHKTNLVINQQHTELRYMGFRTSQVFEVSN